NALPVLRTEDEGSQDEDIERALQQREQRLVARAPGFHPTHSMRWLGLGVNLRQVGRRIRQQFAARQIVLAPSVDRRWLGVFADEAQDVGAPDVSLRLGGADRIR